MSVVQEVNSCGKRSRKDPKPPQGFSLPSSASAGRGCLASGSRRRWRIAGFAVCGTRERDAVRLHMQRVVVSSARRARCGDVARRVATLLHDAAARTSFASSG